VSGLHITIVRQGERNLSIEVNGEQVASASQEEHGWSGMEAVAETARAIAEAAGLDFHEEGDQGWTG
jgi:hypothetical protein